MNNETSYFLFQIISFKKYFYVSLGNIFLLFLWRPPSCGGRGQLPSLPPLNSRHRRAPAACVSVCLSAGHDRERCKNG